MIKVDFIGQIKGVIEFNFCLKHFSKIENLNQIKCCTLWVKHERQKLQRNVCLTSARTNVNKFSFYGSLLSYLFLPEQRIG